MERRYEPGRRQYGQRYEPGRRQYRERGRSYRPDGEEYRILYQDIKPEERVRFMKDKKEFKGEDDNSPRQSSYYWFPNKDSQIKWYTDPYYRITPFDKYNRNFYHYKKACPKEIYRRYEKLQRASIIPYIKYKGLKYWLLGSFNDYPEVKTDFGGKCDQENTANMCSIRELSEETRGVLSGPIEEAIKDGLSIVYRGRNIDNRYTFFILVDVSNRLDALNKIQTNIEKAAINDPKGEEFGPIGFYRDTELFKGTDHKSGEKIYTTFALTDFINNIKRSKRKGNPLYDY